MEPLQLAAVVVMITAGCAGWLIKQFWNSVQELRKEINDLKVLISSEYIRYDRLAETLKPIMDTLVEIKQSLERKVNK